MYERLKQYWSASAVMSEVSPWKTALCYGIAVYAVLALLQPFGLASDASYVKYVYLLAYLVITVVGVLLPFVAIPFFKPDFYVETNWTHGRSFVASFLTLALIMGGNLLYSLWLGFDFDAELAWLVFWQTMVVTAGVSGIKYWMVSKKLQQDLLKINELNKQIQRRKEPELCTWVTIEGAGKNANVRVDVMSLLYVESDRNYCNIVCREDDELKRWTIRTTISALEEQLGAYPFIVRSHRAFLVNVAHVGEIAGNSAGYRLRLKGVEAEVPVSRSFASAVLDKLDRA